MQTAKDALTFPENLGEGKLALDTDNDVHYLSANCTRLRAGKRWRGSISRWPRGEMSPYRRTCITTICRSSISCASRAYKKLGNETEAERIKSLLLRYVAENEDKKKEIDYFAVSLPDLLIWETDPYARNRQFCESVRTLAMGI